ncbi:MAG: energy transducer TonB [Proteobacteria bacterium]|nr:energy transducer TonB [Pseudomonadota bacterium]
MDRAPQGKQLQKNYSIRQKIELSICISLLLHLFAAFLLSSLPIKHFKSASKHKIPVKLQFLEKKTLKPETALDKSRQLEREHRIVEAPLPPTQKPDHPAFLGAQDHATQVETRTQAKPSPPAAEPTAVQNGRLHLETTPVAEGRIVVSPGKNYQDFLPKKIDIVNTGYNDYLPDKNLKIGPLLDVNTTDFRFIAYFTSVRKQVELAYYDIGASLQEKSYVREKIDSAGQARLEGSSLVQLKVNRSGLLVESKLIDSSGDRDVDAIWTRILNLAAPYPPLPRDFPDEILSFTYRLYYDLSFQGERKSKRLRF